MTMTSIRTTILGLQEPTVCGINSDMSRLTVALLYTELSFDIGPMHQVGLQS